MSDFITVVANHPVEVTVKDGSLEMRNKGDAPFMISAKDFADLGPEGLKAVRRAAAVERQVAKAVALVPHHRGGGKWEVRDEKGATISLDELFDSKDDAQAWIDLRLEASSV